MTRKILLLICFSILIFSCSKNSEIQIEIKKYHLNSEKYCNGSNCTFVDLEIPTVISEDSIAKEINKTVFHFIKEEIEFETDSIKINSYNQLMQSFVSTYDDLKTNFPNEPLPWEATIKGSFENFENKSINIVFDYYTYTGGNHGNEGVKSFFFDTKTGKQIPQKELFLDYSGFKKIAEQDFRKSLNLAATDNINKNGNLFENDQFSLPQNIIVTQNEIILHYNKYEIAPYSSGTTILKFPMKTFKKYLNPLYF